MVSVPSVPAAPRLSHTQRTSGCESLTPMAIARSSPVEPSRNGAEAPPAEPVELGQTASAIDCPLEKAIYGEPQAGWELRFRHGQSWEMGGMTESIFELVKADGTVVWGVQPRIADLHLGLRLMVQLIAGVAVFAGAAALFRLESLRETLAIVRKLWHKTC